MQLVFSLVFSVQVSATISSVSTSNCAPSAVTGSVTFTNKDSIIPSTPTLLQKMLNGGYVLVQQRLDGGVYFNKTWAQFQAGFGSYSGAYWIGNDKLNLLTNVAGQTCLAHFDIQGLNAGSVQGWFWAELSQFSIESASKMYQISIGGSFSGSQNVDNAVNQCTNYYNSCPNGGNGCPSVLWCGNRNIDNIDGQNFATYDRPDSNGCATQDWAGYWYDDCSTATINNGNPTSADGFTWQNWKYDGNTGYKYLQASRLWIKCS